MIHRLCSLQPADFTGLPREHLRWAIINKLNSQVIEPFSCQFIVPCRILTSQLRG